MCTMCAPGDQRKGSDNRAGVGRTERVASSAARRVSDDVIAARQAMTNEVSEGRIAESVSAERQLLAQSGRSLDVVPGLHGRRRF